MKVLFLTAGSELVASSRTRVYQYLPHLRKIGIDARVINYIDPVRCGKNLSLTSVSFLEKIPGRIFSWIETLKVIILAKSYDILFIQKVLLARPVLDLLKKLNANIIFDFDDAMYLADRFTDASGRNTFLDRFNHTLKVSKFVIVENEQNESYARKFNPNVARITGPIDILRYMPGTAVSSGKKGIVIGWIGSPEAARYLKKLSAVFRTISEKHKDVSIRLIGSGDFGIEGVKVEIKDWSLDTETEDLRGFDIGIMPLADDEWSRGKGGYKLLQYMAIGIPCVASPVGVNKDIIKNGSNGYLAGIEKEWDNALSRLIADGDLRRKMGEEGRRVAEEMYSYEAALPKFTDVLNTVMGAGK